MSAPPPPPPPPPPAPPPPPSMGRGGGGGGGAPAFLADIRKGTQLKKVPDSLKNDRSAALVSGVGVTGGSGGGSLGGGGGEKRPGPPMGGGGAVPSNADIKARLTAMFAGGGAHVPTAQPVKPPQPQKSLPPAPPPPAPPPPPPQSRSSAQVDVNPPPPPPPVIPVLPSQQSQPQVPRPRREAPQVPVQNALEGSRMPRPKSQAPPPPPPPPPPSSSGNQKPGIQSDAVKVPPRVPARDVDPWEARFCFPDESTFPPVPEPYRGNKTFVYYRASGDDL